MALAGVFIALDAIKNIAISTTPSLRAVNSGTTTPPVGHPFKLKGNFLPLVFIPLL